MVSFVFFIAAFFALNVRGEDPPAVLAPVIVESDRPPGNPAQQSSEFVGGHVPVDRNGESHLTRVLGRRTAVFAQRTGGDESVTGFQIRGQDAAQSRYFLESIPLTDAQHHAAQIGWFPVEALGGMDLYPEGTPAILGGDGLGGAVVLRLAPPGFGPSAFGGRVGSFGSRRLFARAAVTAPFPVSVLADGQQSREDFVYRDVAGTPLIPSDDTWARRDHNGYRAFTVLPQARAWRRGADHIDVMSFHTLRRNEIAGPVGLPQNGLLNQQFHLAAMDGTWRVSPAWDWRVGAYAWGHDQAFDAPVEMRALFLTRSQTNAVGGRVTLGYGGDQANGGEASFGIQRDQSLVGNGVGEVSGRRWSLPFGVSARQALGSGWILKPAMTLQGFLYSGGVERQVAMISPRIGVEKKLSRGRLRAVLGRYERAPSLLELFGAPSTVAANRTLANERSLKMELGGDGRFAFFETWVREIQVSATFSAAFNDDLIVFIPNSQWNYVAQNLGRSRILSPEVATEVHVGRGGILRASAAWLWTRNLSEASAYRGKHLPMRPDYRTGVEAEWGGRTWKVAYSLQGTGPLYADAVNARRIAAFWEHSVWGKWDSPLGMWTLELRNLTDALTVNSSDWNFTMIQNTTGLAGFPSPGRRVYVSWRYEI